METLRLFKKLEELTLKALKYKPLEEDEAQGKVLEKILHVGDCEESFTVFLFRDKTALYYEKDWTSPTTDLELVWGYCDAPQKVTAFVTELFHDLDRLNLINREVESELVETKRKYELAWFYSKMDDRISTLQKELKALQKERKG